MPVRIYGLLTWTTLRRLPPRVELSSQTRVERRATGSCPNDVQAAGGGPGSLSWLPNQRLYLAPPGVGRIPFVPQRTAVLTPSMCPAIVSAHDVIQSQASYLR